MITIKEIAGIVGVSTTTVSNVIHGKAKEVSPATVEKIQKVLKEYNYTPNISARNLASNRSRIIGVIMKSHHEYENNRFVDPFVSELLGGVLKRANQNGYSVMVYNTWDIQELKRYIMSWNMDGMVMVGFVAEEIYSIQAVCNRPMAIIDVYDYLDMENCISIGLEDRKGMYHMVKHVISCGHKKIAFLADNDINVDHERRIGFQRAMSEAGLEAGEREFIKIIPGDYHLLVNMDEIYQRSFSYTALVCVSDYYAVHVMNGLKDRGRSIPDDISITGFDDSYLSRFVRPALTTVRQDVEQKGKTAVEHLCAMIENPEERSYRNVVFPTELVIRDSIRKIAE